MVSTSNKCRIDLHINKICQKLTICWYTGSFNVLLRRMLQIHILFAGWLNTIHNSGKFTLVIQSLLPKVRTSLMVCWKCMGFLHWEKIQKCNKTKHQKIQWVYSFLQTSTSKKQTIEGPVAGSPLSRYGINLSPRASARWIFFVPGRDLLVVGVWSFRPPLKVEDRLIEVGIRGKESWFKETCNRT